jgi:hypothetical protein
MVLSDSSGNVDPNWFNISASTIVDTVNLKGETSVTSGSSHNYIITDYDQYSTYSISSSQGSISINNNVITVEFPVVSQLSEVVLYITRNTNTLPFSVEVSP